MRDAPESGLLDRLLQQVRLRAAFIVVGQMGRGAFVDLPAEGSAALHYVRGGSCAIWIEGVCHELAPGDVLLMRRGLERKVGVGTMLSSTPFHAVVGELRSGRVARFAVGPGEGQIEVLGMAGCSSALDPGIALLPPVCVLHGSDALAGHIDALMAEVASEAPGASALAVRLAELVFIRAIRDVVLERPEGTALALAATEPRLARALLALQRDLAGRWTVPRLASAAGMSRSSFAELFSATLGASPMRFVRRWRMAEATQRLRSGAQVQEVAEAVGYESVAAFSVAFKEVVGAAPSSLKSGVPRDD